MSQPDETTLTEMLGFIRGEGQWRHLGGGITTYPDSDNNGAYAVCLELERRGLVYRFNEYDAASTKVGRVVIWKAVTPDKEPG